MQSIEIDVTALSNIEGKTMFTQTMIQNLGALKISWHWLSMMLMRSIGGARKFKTEK